MLVQAATLYFGQPNAFSYSQHIAGILVAQVRRMGICSRTPVSPPELDTSSQEGGLGKWIHRECEKRLTYAVMRLQCYTSVLHSARPLLSAEEMDVELPCSHHLWHRQFSSTAALVGAIKQDLEIQRVPMLFSDLLRIAIDGEEPIPSLTFLEQELFMNGLQEYVWLASNGSKTLHRLVSDTTWTEVDDFDDVLDHKRRPPDSNVPRRQQLEAHQNQSIDAYIAHHGRRLSSLQQRRRQVVESLRRWQSGSFTGQLPSTIADRSSLLSCLLLYHLAFLQLRCPLDLIHMLPYLPKDQNSSQQNTLTEVLKWGKSEDAVVVLKHALAIVGYVEQETKRPLATRSQVNFLTLVGLHHSAAVVWILAGIHREPIAGENTSCAERVNAVGMNIDDEPVPICQANKTVLMEAFSKLYTDISPAWAGKSSFSAAVMRMRGLDFPALLDTVSCQ